ncbi:MAG TPA: glutamate-cysteine ligase family protein, partial [Thermoanaerobaculia bacterium]|nr:glutamate-cysteine ligase family protein [Thermoanaerobaculia bacterium]
MGAPRPSFTLGIEEEFQIIDPATRALKAHVQELFAAGELRLKDKIKREFHQSVVEVGTGICKDITEARADVTNLRRELVALTGSAGLAIGAAGTHPFTHWSEVPITPNPRY